MTLSRRRYGALGLVPNGGNHSKLAELFAMADAGPNPSHLRALRLCHDQAALAIDEVTRSTLLGLAAAYRQQAERLELEQPEPARRLGMASHFNDPAYWHGRAQELRAIADRLADADSREQLLAWCARL